MFIDFLLNVFEEQKQKDAIIWQGKVYSYGWLLGRVHDWMDMVRSENIRGGIVLILEGDFSPNSVALFLALVECGCIVVPLTTYVEAQKSEFIEIARGEVRISISENDDVEISKLPFDGRHQLYEKLKNRKHPGLVLFSSGSTGQCKAAVHDLIPIMDKFRLRREGMRTITFLLYDHIGGINTMLYTLSNGGCIVAVNNRSPDDILRMIEKCRVELLPTSPTFINLLLLSEAYKQHRMDSLKVVTYGTEPMPESTLKRFHRLFPWIRLQQTYGLSEVGILRSKSRSSDSVWVKVGGEGYETRIRDGILHIKAKSAMLGYLNAASPFTEDGWLDTGDYVEVDNEYVKIVGRRSDMINVGGEKVYPTEVEDAIQEMENVAEVTVYGEPNAIVGSIVCAKITLARNEDPESFKRRLRMHCARKVEKYKLPVKVKLIFEKQHTNRFKKIRPI